MNFVNSQQIVAVVKFEDEIKQRKFSSDFQKATLNVIFTANWIHAHFRDVFKPFDLTQQQYNVLRILRGKHPKSANPGEIKDVMLDKNPDLTRLCDRLYNLGLIHREADPVNRRKINIKISDEGLKLLKKIDPKIQAIEEVMTTLSPEEATMLSDLLDKLRNLPASRK